MTDVPTLTSLVSRSHPGRSAVWPRSTVQRVRALEDHPDLRAAVV